MEKGLASQASSCHWPANGTGSHEIPVLADDSPRIAGIAFPSGNVWNDQNVELRAATRARRVVVHANYLKGRQLKLDMLRSAGLWQGCSSNVSSVC